MTLFPNTIYPRILAPLALTLAAGSLAAWWLASSLFANSLQEQREIRLDDAIGVLAGGNLPLTQDLLLRLGELLQADLYLITGDGRVTPDSGETPFPEVIRQAWSESKERAYSTFGQYREQGYSILIQPLQRDTGGYAAIAAVAGLSELHRASGRMALQLGLGAIVGALLLSWLLHRIARGITAPITRLSRMAERVATGDLEARVNIRTPREVAELGDSLNRMAAQLQGYQREIAEQNRLQALGEMAARVAHEIRNPLTAIKLQIQLLGEARQDEGQQKRVRRLLEEVQRLELIVSSLLTTGGEIELRRRPTVLNELIGEVLALLQPQLAHRRITVEQRLAPLPASQLDPDRIKQVLFNLINNATDELAQGGRILITTGLDPTAGQERIVMMVEDSGPGIPARMLQAGRFRATASRKPHGLGIGLVICHELLERHRGELLAGHSQALGGAAFTVCLPLEPPEEDSR